MIESTFWRHVTAGVSKFPSRPVLTVVVLTRAGEAHRCDLYDPSLAIDLAVSGADRSDSVDASRDVLEQSQVVHLDGQWKIQISLTCAWDGFSIRARNWFAILAPIVRISINPRPLGTTFVVAVVRVVFLFVSGPSLSPFLLTVGR